MTAPGRYARAARPAAVAAPAVRKSRYAGIAPTQPRTPFPNVGEYVVTIAAITVQFNDGKKRASNLVEFTLDAILSGGEGHEQGELCAALYMDNIVQVPKFVAFCMAVAGFDNEDEYLAFDPEGEWPEACEGKANRFTDEAGGVNPAIGVQLYVKVTRGKDIADKDGRLLGDWFREYQWEPIPPQEGSAT